MAKLLGTKLRLLREGAGLIQDEVGKAVGLSGEFISQLEIGRRRPSLDSLTSLAGFFKKDVSYFLTEEGDAFDLLSSKLGSQPQAAAVLRKFRQRCEDYLFLEDSTSRRIEPAPEYFRVSPESMAGEERRRLGIGLAPIADIFSLVETNGLRLIRQPIDLDMKIAGIYVFLKNEEAAFALVNCSQSSGLQKMMAAHLYCHFLRDRRDGPVVDNPDVLVAEYVSLYHPKEQFAQKFASRFLLPPERIREILQKDVGKSGLCFEHVLYLKRRLDVGIFALLQALKDLGLLSPSKSKEFQEKDADRLEESIFGDVRKPEEKVVHSQREIFSDRYRWLSVEALRKGRLDAQNIPKRLVKQLSRFQPLLKEI